MMVKEHLLALQIPLVPHCFRLSHRHQLVPHSGLLRERQAQGEPGKPSELDRSGALAHEAFSAYFDPCPHLFRREP